MMTEARALKLKACLEQMQIPGYVDAPAPDYIKPGFLTPTVFIRPDSPTVVRVSGEDGKGLADYYYEGRDRAFGVHANLDAWAQKHGCFWEWEDPGCIALYEL